MSKHFFINNVVLLKIRTYTPSRSFRRAFSDATETSETGASLVEYFDHTPLQNFHVYSCSNTGLCNKKWLNFPEDLINRAYRAIDKGTTITKEITVNETWSLKSLIHKFDAISDTLCDIADTAEFLRHVHPHEAYRDCADRASQLIGSFMQSLNTNLDLYSTLKKRFPNEGFHEKLTQEEHMVCKSFIQDFEFSGINMSRESREKFAELHQEIQKIGWSLTQSIGCIEHSDGLDRSHLLDYNAPESQVLGGLNKQSSMRSLLSSSFDPKVRESAYRYLYRPNEKRLSLLAALLTSRRDLANHLGYASYSDLFLQDKLVKGSKQVSHFLNQLSKQIMPSALREYEILKTKHRAYYGYIPSKIAPWDKIFLMNEVRNDILKDVGNRIQEYFSLGRCILGLNRILEGAFGVQLRPGTCSLNELWSRDVRKLELWNISKDQDDEAKLMGPLGIIYLDLFPRENKYLNAAHFTLQCGKSFGSVQRQNAVVAVVCNFNPPMGSNEACLLTYSDVETLFHEMGHALHSILGQTEFQNVSGTRCKLDFLEVPSTLMEHFLLDEQFVQSFARHVHTKEELPKEWFHRIMNAKRAFCSLETQDQILYALTDQAYHSFQEFIPPSDIDTSAIYHELELEYTLFDVIESTAPQLSLTHLVHYGACYYSYLYCRVIASNLWESLFMKNPLDAYAGRLIRNKILCRGGGCDPEELLQAVLGKNFLNCSHFQLDSSSGNI